MIREIWNVENLADLATAKVRKEKLIEALLHRRKQNENPEKYPEMISEICSALINQMAYEIISEGSLLNQEPEWNGLFVNNNGNISVFNPKKYKYVSNTVKRYRNSPEFKPTKYKTHTKIAELLEEPTLFKVIGRWDNQSSSELYEKVDITWYTNDWVNETNSELPIKNELNVDQNVLLSSLKDLHKKVLWPAFEFEAPKQPIAVSLVLLLSTRWHVNGVWAFHFTASAESNGSASANSSKSLEMIINPPTLCLQDLLGAHYVIENRHEKRKNATIVYKISTGMIDNSNDFEYNTDSDNDRETYSKLIWSSNTIDLLGNVFENSCMTNSQNNNPIVSGSISEPISKAICQGFIALNFNKLEENSMLSQLLLQNSIKLAKQTTQTKCKKCKFSQGCNLLNTMSEQPAMPFSTEDGLPDFLDKLTYIVYLKCKVKAIASKIDVAELNWLRAGLTAILYCYFSSDLNKYKKAREDIRWISKDVLSYVESISGGE